MLRRPDLGLDNLDRELPCGVVARPRDTTRSSRARGDPSTSRGARCPGLTHSLHMLLAHPIRLIAESAASLGREIQSHLKRIPPSPVRSANGTRDAVSNP